MDIRKDETSEDTGDPSSETESRIGTTVENTSELPPPQAHNSESSSRSSSPGATLKDNRSKGCLPVVNFDGSGSETTSTTTLRSKCDDVTKSHPPDTVYLPDATVSDTETEPPPVGQANRKHSRQVSFHLDEAPSTSFQPEARREEVIQIQPPNSTDTGQKSASRIHKTLEMLYLIGNKLETIKQNQQEQQWTSVRPSAPTVILQLPQFSELGTQTAELAPRVGRGRLRLDLTSVQDENVPPCERTHHTIMITGHNMPPAEPVVQQSMFARMGRTIGDFAAAVCLCLQVNKDCVFCLGFFVAFVVSASFLTAFFYRTLSFTTNHHVRMASMMPPMDPTGHYDLATVRFNGGYYYIYNPRRLV